jgi:IrrE N-terminal-like domain
MTAKLTVPRKSIAEGAANLVLREMKIDGLRVDPMAIATDKGILLKEKPDTVDGVSGMLVKVGDQFGIMYATNIPSKGFQKFSVAHEIGHYCISGHVDALLSNGAHYSRAGFQSADPYEMEADYFAAALLMPERPFKSAIDDHPTGLVGIEALAKACETSLTATAIRYSGFTRDGVAIILSTAQAVDYCFMSEGLKEAKGLKWLRKGTPVPGGTVTESFNAREENIRTGQKDSGDGNLRDWMDTERGYSITEEVIGLGQYGRTLTVLTCTSLTSHVEEAEDDDDEEKMIESWTPRFRK